MTRQFNAKIRCQHCGGITTEETPMNRWIRNHPLLDSKNGIAVFDIDILLHRFRLAKDLKGEREIECMMFIEVKTFGAKPSISQRDTLSLLNQTLRNRKRNRFGDPRRQVDCQLGLSYSLAKRKEIRLRLLGGHLLQLSGADPGASEWMKWDNKHIDINTLVELMLFDRDPDNLGASREDWMRRRSAPFAALRSQPTLFSVVDLHEEASSG